MQKQAAAAIGQPRLMQAWSEAFARVLPPARSRSVAQVLLTAEDIEHRGRFLNARRTLECLLDSGVVPIINENDSVSFDEIKLGDNDRLSALTATLVGADALVLLSSVPGVLENADRAVVPEIRSLEAGLALVRTDKSETGVGGMETKVRAACSAAAMGIGTVIAGGQEARIVSRLLSGEGLGTFFPPATGGSEFTARASSRKKWLGLSARPKGRLIVDDGARLAILKRGSSLLPSGLLDAVGDFDAGALVEVCRGEKGAGGRVSGVSEPFARGLACYPADDLRRLRGLKTSQIEQVLGYHYSDEAVHRDDLVVLGTMEDAL
jgi:glutamate 5-kinase